MIWWYEDMKLTWFLQKMTWHDYVKAYLPIMMKFWVGWPFNRDKNITFWWWYDDLNAWYYDLFFIKMTWHDKIILKPTYRLWWNFIGYFGYLPSYLLWTINWMNNERKISVVAFIGVIDPLNRRTGILCAPYLELGSQVGTRVPP